MKVQKKLKSKVIRVSKLISHAGICSRREAENLIKKGEVTVNGQISKDYVLDIDKIQSLCVSKKKIKKQKSRIWIFYKPVGFVSSNKEQFNQKSLFRLLPQELPRVVSVGRLDIKSEGLMILTNNPTISNYLESPVNKIERIYLVDAIGKVTESFLKKIKEIIKIKGVIYQNFSLKVLSSSHNKHCFEIRLFEGKNREIRNILNHFGFNVQKLKRMKYGPFQLGSLIEGKVSEISNLKVNFFLKKLGLSDENNFW